MKLVAVNIDGVLLPDSFSPVIYRFVVGRGLAYTAELERSVLSQSQMAAAQVLGLGDPEVVVREFFREREAYVREHPVRVVAGAEALLGRLRSLGVKLVCYGGLRREHFDRYLGHCAELFDGPGYVCTDGFRPGVREIAEDVFGLECERALFIDDVARVAEAARERGAAFIGHPSSFEHSFQRELMAQAGVRHLVDSLEAIDERLLEVVDAEAAAGRLWSPAA
ncbi:HAD family phosphatase [Streptomyces sp. NPDC057877]|uniref:HAD family phosphatase n=1 Tax=Streptomyces sp. NPDC057877 TaxID=3346269 RepID=UPI00369FBD88